MKRFHLSPIQKYLVVKSLSASYFAASYVVFNLNYSTGSQVAKAWFYLTGQQILTLLATILMIFIKL